MSEFLEATAAAMLDSLGYMQADSVTYKGVTAFCVATEKRTETLSFGGFEEHFAGFVRVAKNGFPDPVKGEKLTVNGNELRITSYDEDPISWKIYLEDISR